MQAACSNVHHRLSNRFWLPSVNIYTLKAYNCKFTIERNVKQFTFRRYLSLRKLPVHCVLSTAVSFSIYQTWNERHEGRFVQQEKIFILFQSNEKMYWSRPFWTSGTNRPAYFTVANLGLTHSVHKMSQQCLNWLEIQHKGMISERYSMMVKIM